MIYKRQALPEPLTDECSPPLRSDHGQCCHVPSSQPSEQCVLLPSLKRRDLAGTVCWQMPSEQHKRTSEQSSADSPAGQQPLERTSRPTSPPLLLTEPPENVQQTLHTRQTATRPQQLLQEEPGFLPATGKSVPCRAALNARGRTRAGAASCRMTAPRMPGVLLCVSTATAGPATHPPHCTLMPRRRRALRELQSGAPANCTQGCRFSRKAAWLQPGQREHETVHQDCPPFQNTRPRATAIALNVISPCP